jgi:hypothetical protein
MTKPDNNLLLPRGLAGVTSHNEPTPALEPLHAKMVLMNHVRFCAWFCFLLSEVVLGAPGTCLVPGFQFGVIPDTETVYASGNESFLSDTVDAPYAEGVIDQLH